MSGKFGLTVRVSKEGDLEIVTNETEHENAIAAEIAKAFAPNRLSPAQQFSPDRYEDLSPIAVEHATRKFMLDRAGQITPGTKRTWQTSFNKLVGYLGDRTAHQVTTEDISTALQNIAVLAAPKTVKKDAQTWAMLWRWMIDRKHAREQVVKIPTWGRAQLVRLNQERGRDRLSYDQSDLNKIFDPARLNTLVRPEEIFLPFLGLYSGARLEALCRLKCPDFTDSTLRFDAGHDKTGKERTIPLHPDLLSTGILTYVSEIRSEFGPDSMIFPHLNEVRGRYGHYFSKRYGEQRRTLGIAKGKDFHSFRVHLITHLQTAGCPPDLRRLFVGHETGEKLDIHERTYSKASFTPQQLAELVFPYISFTHPNWSYKKETLIQPLKGMRRAEEVNKSRISKSLVSNN